MRRLLRHYCVYYCLSPPTFNWKMCLRFFKNALKVDLLFNIIFLFTFMPCWKLNSMTLFTFMWCRFHYACFCMPWPVLYLHELTSHWRTHNVTHLPLPDPEQRHVNLFSKSIRMWKMVHRGCGASLDTYVESSFRALGIALTLNLTSDGFTRRGNQGTADYWQIKDTTQIRLTRLPTALSTHIQSLLSVDHF